MTESAEAPGGGYSPAQRRELTEAIARGEEPSCPACGAEVVRREVRPGAAVSYVRRRAWLLCTACKRGAAVDLPRER